MLYLRLPSKNKNEKQKCLFRIKNTREMKASNLSHSNTELNLVTLKKSQHLKFNEQQPHSELSVLTFVIKAINAIYTRTLMISTQKKEVFWILDFIS